MNSRYVVQDDIMFTRMLNLVHIIFNANLVYVQSTPRGASRRPITHTSYYIIICTYYNIFYNEISYLTFYDRCNKKGLI